VTTQKTATIIGGGVIGGSWAALFLAHGMKVLICDPAPKIKEIATPQITAALEELASIGLTLPAGPLSLIYDPVLSQAVASADIIQENGPEKKDFKQHLWVDVEKYCKPDALLLSSSSGIPASEQSQLMSHPERLVIGHPFTPPHIMPLVEVVPGSAKNEDTIKKVIAFYEGLGKTVVVLRKEITSFVGNRLQSALFREAVYLVREGVVSVDELDRVVTASLGIRWAVAGPFKSFHLGGGPGGLQHFLDTLGGSMERLWPHLGTASFDDSTKKLLMKQANESFAKVSYDVLTSARDKKELAMVSLLKKAE
jgi:ketoreductase RED1